MIKLNFDNAVQQIRDFLNPDIENGITFLAGAGISLAQPSGLPSGRDIIQTIIETSTEKNVQGELLKLADALRSDMRNENDFLRFEKLLQTIQESLDPELNSLQILLPDDRDPNDLHLILAERSIKGDILITTNFDNLLEKAVLHLHGKCKQIASDDEFNRFSSTSSKEGIGIFRNTIFKIHGSLKDISGRNTTHTIQATLERMIKGQGQMLLSPGRFNVLGQTLKQTPLIILGYSGFDDFDIIPSLMQIPEIRRIVWIDHKGDAGENEVQIITHAFDPDGSINQKNSVESKHLSRLSQLLQSLNSPNNHRSRVTPVILVRGNTSIIMQALFGQKNKPNAVKETITELPSIWLSGDVRVRSWVTGRLFHEMQRYEKAIEYYKQYQTSLKALNDESLIEVHLYLSMAQSSLRKNREAAENIQHCLNLLHFYPFNSNASRVLLWAGNLASWLPLPQQIKIPNHLDKNGVALELSKLYWRDAIRVAEMLGDSPTKASAYHQLSVISHMMGNNSIAFDYIDRAHEIRKSLGDLVGIASCLSTKASYLIYINPGQAEKWLKESLSIFRMLGYEYEMVFPLVTIITLLNNQYTPAEEFYFELRRIVNKTYIHSRLDLSTLELLNNMGMFRTYGI